MVRFVWLLMLALSSSLYAAETIKTPQISQPQRLQFYVIEFDQGPAWIEGVRYEKQPDIEPHLNYWKGLYYQEILLMSGPWQDGSGGIFIVRSNDRKMVEAIIEQDPAVGLGVIQASIHEWRVLSSAMRSVKPFQIEIEPDDSFRVERLDPASPINLRKN
tara:strand:+ start:31983 stop:32462 length:480 start_codon:yes stop_codon:yes gene_type:complete